MNSKQLGWRWPALLALLFATSSPALAQAGGLRAVLLVSQTIDGAHDQTESLEAAGLRAFGKAGLRAIELETSLASQEALFSDMVQAGKLPPALSTLNADALVSLAMVCEKSTEKLLRSPAPRRGAVDVRADGSGCPLGATMGVGSGTGDGSERGGLLDLRNTSASVLSDCWVELNSFWKPIDCGAR